MLEQRIQGGRIKSLDYVIKNYKSEAIDGRDLSRLGQFIPEERLSEVGILLKEEYRGKHKHIEFTKESILKQLEEDVKFGYEKAINERGISSSCMYACVKMWNWVLEEGLEDFDNYGSYGMPLFIETAKKYDFKLF